MKIRVSVWNKKGVKTSKLTKIMIQQKNVIIKKRTCIYSQWFQGKKYQPDCKKAFIEWYNLHPFEIKINVLKKLEERFHQKMLLQISKIIFENQCCQLSSS